MTHLNPLLSRHSTPSRLLGEPGPDARQLEAMLRAAVHVPDHGRLMPWRFLRIEGDARHALGQILAERSRERVPDAPEAAVEKDRNRFSHAPLVIAVISRLTPDHKIPVQEQLLSGGAVCFSLLLAAHASGFSAQWLTGWAAYDPVVTHRLGLGENERVLGFIHIGTPKEETPDRLRPEPSDLLSDWNPA